MSRNYTISEAIEKACRVLPKLNKPITNSSILEYIYMVFKVSEKESVELRERLGFVRP